MHADEANQAVKTGELLEHGRYVFDPRDHHGPTLYFAAVPIAWMRRQSALAALDETTLRLTTAAFGTLTVVLLAVLVLPAGWPAALLAAAFLAAAPAAVYFSRYFIQETLLVAFILATAACSLQWQRGGGIRWAIAAGACAGFALATKATAAVFLAAMGAAMAVARRPRGDIAASRPTAVAVAAAVGAALVIAALLYTSFGSNPRGGVDALASHVHGLTRATGDSGHDKPWWYYLRLLVWHHDGGLVWQQLFFSLLGAAGFAVAVQTWRERRNDHGSRVARGAAVFAAVVAVVLSAVSYKTPWHLIHFAPPLCALAAIAVVQSARLAQGRLLAVALVVAALGSLVRETWRASFVRPSDARNPYAYVHSAPDVLKYRALADAALAAWPGENVKVVSEEYWPLPWYFRGLPRVGYWTEPPADCDGALVIASAQQAEAVRAKLKVTYRETFLGLRPGFVCVLFHRAPPATSTGSTGEPR